MDIKWIISEELYMKKLGFTLAEVLIAMGLVGVVSAMTLPSFVKSTQNESYAAKLSSTVSAVENALTSMIADEGMVYLIDTRFGENPTAGNLGRYLKGSASTYNRGITFIAGGNSNIAGPGGAIFETKTGAKLFINAERNEYDPDVVAGLGGSVSRSVANIVIDVNGETLPNKWGRDAFYFMIGDDGILYPAGSRNFSILKTGGAGNLYNSVGNEYACTNANLKLGCTARLVENNYKVDF